MQVLTLPETISQIEHLIDEGKGDAGRLYFILESLQNNKKLYRSDEKYLEAKLQATFTRVTPKSKPTNLPVLEKIKNLMDSGAGDPGRLQHIHDTIAKGKVLYHSDQVYLESKLNEIDSGVDNNVTIQETSLEKPEPVIEKPKESFNKPKEVIPTKPKGALPKGWESESKEKENEINKKLKVEEEKLQQQKQFATDLESQRQKLSQLVTTRQNYEKQIKEEKSKLESQISQEREKIALQTQLSEQIAKQKKELEKVKNERNTILKAIEKEKSLLVEQIQKQTGVPLFFLAV